MRSIYRAMGKSDKLRLICLALILFVYPVAGSNYNSQPHNPQNNRPGYTLTFPKGQAYKVYSGQERIIWAQGARRICL
jgi:hypothetical protein